jgi:hypothetical protein
MSTKNMDQTGLNEEVIELFDKMKEVLKSTEIYSNDKTKSQHVDHCLHQLLRFANLALKGHPFRALQFGYNLGRLQEILESIGGHEFWWKPFEKQIEDKNWISVAVMVMTIMNRLDFGPPNEEFINKI